ncbi:hypothetical protein BH23BAC4_BH23BAC4_12860 [soil metagenome]
MRYLILATLLTLPLSSSYAQDVLERDRTGTRIADLEMTAPAQPAMNPPVDAATLAVENEGGDLRLWLDGSGALIVPGIYVGSTGSVPVSGDGARLMWIPERAAFRVGRAGDQQAWDPTSTGNYSMAFGLNTRASGWYSTAMGSGTTASGSRATAMGGATTASGTFSTSMGINTTASGMYSTSMGQNTTAHAYASVVLGRYNVIAGHPTAWHPQPLFVAGNGTSDGARSNALTLLNNGNMTIAGTLTQNSDSRLKENIVDLEGGLESVLGLRTVRYQFREGANRPEGEHIGLIAQEVYELLPELVHEDSEGFLSVAYQNLAPVLAAAMQEQQAEIERLRAELASERAANEERFMALEASIREMRTGEVVHLTSAVD